MTWLDSLTLVLYTLNTVLAGIGWPPFVTLYNHVIIVLKGKAEV